MTVLWTIVLTKSSDENYDNSHTEGQEVTIVM
jgi:hypothetical protein